MYEESNDQMASVYEKLVHAEKISHQCKNIPGSKFLSSKSILKCKNLHKLDAYLRLGPQRLESLSENPSVSMFHDFLTDHQCNEFRGIGKGK